MGRNKTGELITDSKILFVTFATKPKEDAMLIECDGVLNFQVKATLL